MDKFNQIKAIIASLEEDAEKFYVKGNKAAGTRLRTGLQAIKNLAQEVRVDVQNQKNQE
ncbi:MAG: histone H1 [Bacteroidia bacterium]|nr:histone H1 [Bacteroidia bacterium]